MKRQPINTDNYEEYFLLYVDNELTEAERRSVEDFVRANPEFQSEFEMLQSTKLDLEDVKMEDLGSLYRHEEGLINQDNLEEYQVLMVDGELSKEEERALDAYQQEHPEALKNLEWLKKTKLEPEEIILPNKELLYRRDKKPASIISMVWIRYAAAAAVLLLAGLFWLNGNDEPGTELANTGQSKTGSPGKDNTKEPNADEQTKIAGLTDKASKNPGNNESNATILDKTGQGEQTSPSVTGQTKSRSAQYADQGKLIKEQQDALANKKAIQPSRENPAVTEQQQIAAVEKNETRISTEDLHPAKTAEPEISAVPYSQPAVAMNVKTNYAAEALTGVHEEDDQSMEHEEEGKRRGLRGIVRKANRIYNKVTNPDLDKPLVKVANFEIGLQR